MTRILSDKFGTFSLLAAIMMPILILGVGVGIDYGLALNASQRLKSSADAAALAAVREAQAAYITHENVDFNSLMKETAVNFFNANIGNNPGAKVLNVDVNSSIRENEITANINFKAEYATNFVQIFGFKKLGISNSSTADIKLPSYININFLIDTSASMAIGATVDEMKKVSDATGCAFACHVGNPGTTSYEIARNAGARMRIDVERDAAISAVEVASNIDIYNHVSFSLFNFSNTLTTVIPVNDSRSSDLKYVKEAMMDGIKLDIYNGGTNIENSIKSVSEIIPESGAGLTPNDRVQYLIVLTDGVESGQSWVYDKKIWVRHPSTVVNQPWQAYAPHEVNYSLNSASCDELKRKKVAVYFIYTEYLTPTSGRFGGHDVTRFNFVKNILLPIIPDRLSKCAGNPDKIIKASTPDEIRDQFSNLVKMISSPLRLM